MTWWLHEELWQETRQFFAVVNIFLLLPLASSSLPVLGRGMGSNRTAGAGVVPGA